MLYLLHIRARGLHVGYYPPLPVSLLGPAPTLSPFFQLAQAIFEPDFFPYKYPNILNPSHSSYLPAYEDGTDRVHRNVGIQNSDAGELPRRKHTTPEKLEELDLSYSVFDIIGLEVRDCDRHDV